MFYIGEVKFFGGCFMKVFLIIVIIFIIIGFLKFRIVVFLNDEEGIKVKLKIVIVKIFEYPFKEKKQGVKFKSSKDDKKEKKGKKKKKKKKNFLQIFTVAKIFIKPLPKLLIFLNKGLKITNLKILMKVAGEDAKKTALDYAKSSTIVFNLLSILEKYCNIKKRNILISPNFLDEKLRYKIFLNAKISIGRIVIGILMYSYFVFIGLLSKNYSKI